MNQNVEVEVLEMRETPMVENMGQKMNSVLQIHKRVNAKVETKVETMEETKVETMAETMVETMAVMMVESLLLVETKVVE